jgi:tartrate-resistant acid phosphatase type 5
MDSSLPDLSASHLDVKFISVLIAIWVVFSSCTEKELIDPVELEVNREADSIVFAVVGDYGHSGDPEKKVSELVKSWNPDFILTTGDNNYYKGLSSTIKDNISQYYGDYIYNFDASAEYRCNGNAFTDNINRFFPTPGNHDADNIERLYPYYSFFTLYSLNTVTDSPDELKTWLVQQLSGSSSPFKIVYFHHSPYTTGSHGNYNGMQWDYKALGIDVVFTGHDHIYNRIEKAGEEGVYYIVNGIGGVAKGSCNANILPSGEFSSFCYDQDFGAIRANATYHKLDIEFYAISDPTQPVDRIEIIAE